MSTYKFKINGKDYEVAVNGIEGKNADVTVNGVKYSVEMENAAPVAAPLSGAIDIKKADGVWGNPAHIGGERNGNAFANCGEASPALPATQPGKSR